MILFDEKSMAFRLDTPNSSYNMQVLDYGFLAHTYYGAKISDIDLGYTFQKYDRSFAPNPNESFKDRSYSLDFMLQEIPCNGTGDFRTSALSIRDSNGNTATSLKYKSHKIYRGKPKLKGLPATYTEDESQADTLEILMEDNISGAEVTLIYTAFNKLDVITRSLIIKNKSSKNLNIEKVMSVNVDFDTCDFDMIHLYGAHCRERNIERRKLYHGKQSIESKRGSSSHHHNPFFALTSHNADENSGDVYGFSFVYSGNFLAEVEVDQFNTTRATMGINPTDFDWCIEPNCEFVAPEVVMVYTNKGIGEMSRIYHKLYQNNLCRGKWKKARRPILVNNWEATYFKFDDNKLVNIARDAADLGIEMLVMDDGWFGHRDDDLTSLGDWFVNETKIKGGLNNLVKQVNDLGIKFGIWFEPEMVSEDSELYRKHPDWCLHVEGRPLSRARHQLVLDFSRQDVRDYIFNRLKEILESANIEYVKWDMNRNITEAGSSLLSADRQKEVFHRYILGVYDMLEKLVTTFPDILLEGCSGGGGRFDPGMLYYSPQIWTSDDTDAIERLKIQCGTSLVYPISAMGAHVSASPNHQTQRVTPFKTRGIVAMSGTFGYELDLNKLTEEEKELVKQQVSEFKKYYNLIAYGDYYRIINPFENDDFCAWCFISSAKDEVLINFVQARCHANPPLVRLKLNGLSPDKKYVEETTSKIYSGDTLINSGLIIPMIYGDGIGYTTYLKAL